MFGFFNVLDEFIGAIAHRRHQRAKIRQRMVGLKECRLVRDPGVRGRVRLWKTVTGERFDIGENLGREFLADIRMLFGAFDEFFAVERDFLFLLLAHDLTQLVHFTHGKTRNVACRSHHLFLIRDSSVGFGSNRFKFGMQVRGFRATVLGANILRDPFHRTRAI